MRNSLNINLSSVDDDVITSILSRRYKDCGKNMPQTAAHLRSIAKRLTAALDAQCVPPKSRAGRRAFYRGGRECAHGAEEVRRSGGLVPFVQFRFAADGCHLFVESLETAAVTAGAPETIIVDVFDTPPTIWVDGPRISKERQRQIN